MSGPWVTTFAAGHILLNDRPAQNVQVGECDTRSAPVAVTLRSDHEEKQEKLEKREKHSFWLSFVLPRLYVRSVNVNEFNCGSAIFRVTFRWVAQGTN